MFRAKKRQRNPPVNIGTFPKTNKQSYFNVDIIEYGQRFVQSNDYIRIFTQREGNTEIYEGTVWQVTREELLSLCAHPTLDFLIFDGDPRDERKANILIGKEFWPDTIYLVNLQAI